MINRCCILVFLLTIGVTIGHAQSFAPDSLPKSFTYSSLTKPLSKESDIQTITLPIPNVDSVEKIEHVLDSLGAIRTYRFGLGIPVNISNHTNGTLEELEKHINTQGRLPGIPSEQDVKENGVNIGDIQSKLLQKIEELTLYMIEIKKENKDLQTKLNTLQQQFQEIPR